MNNKNERLLKIRKLIGNKKISSQDELLKQLEINGFNMTQATLSRDLKLLRVAKMPDGDTGYFYSIPEAESPVSPKSLESFPMNGFLSMEFVKGLGLMKTLPGFASSIASAIDMMKISDIAGTIAGDDTILLIPRDGARKNEITRKLVDFIPGMKQKHTKK